MTDGRLGRCASPRAAVGGTDSCAKPDPGNTGDDRLWISDDPDDPDAREIAGGIDAADGDSTLRAH